MSEEYYTIKEVSEITGISSRSLRHYDEIALVKPDAKSFAGYRLYSAENIRTLQLVMFYRQLDFRLDTIKNLLQGTGRIEILREQYSLMQEKINTLNQSLEILENTLKHEEQGVAMKLEELFPATTPAIRFSVTDEKTGFVIKYHVSFNNEGQGTGYDYVQYHRDKPASEIGDATSPLFEKSEALGELVRKSSYSQLTEEAIHTLIGKDKNYSYEFEEVKNTVYKTLELFDANHQLRYVKVFDGHGKAASHYFDEGLKENKTIEEDMSPTLLSEVEKLDQRSVKENQEFTHQHLPWANPGDFLKTQATLTLAPEGYITLHSGTNMDWLHMEELGTLSLGRHDDQILLFNTVTLAMHPDNTKNSKYYTIETNRLKEAVAWLHTLYPYIKRPSAKTRDQHRYIIKVLTNLDNQERKKFIDEFFTLAVTDAYQLYADVFFGMGFLSQKCHNTDSNTYKIAHILYGKEGECKTSDVLFLSLLASKNSTIQKYLESKNLKDEKILQQYLGDETEALLKKVKTFNPRSSIGGGGGIHINQDHSGKQPSPNIRLFDSAPAENEEDEYVKEIREREVRLDHGENHIILSSFDPERDTGSSRVYTSAYANAISTGMDFARELKSKRAGLEHLFYGCLKHPEPDSTIVAPLDLDAEDYRKFLHQA